MATHVSRVETRGSLRLTGSRFRFKEDRGERADTGHTSRLHACGAPTWGCFPLSNGNKSEFPPFFPKPTVLFEF